MDLFCGAGGFSYGMHKNIHFKTAVAEAVIEEVKPIQARFEEYINNKDYLVEQYRKSAEIAEKISQRTLDKAMKKIGFIAK